MSSDSSTIAATATTSPLRVLVTGAAGFVGFHLCRALRARGDVVLGYDNFNDYYAVELKRAREAELAKIDVKVVQADLVSANVCDVFPIAINCS